MVRSFVVAAPLLSLLLLLFVVVRCSSPSVVVVRRSQVTEEEEAPGADDPAPEVDGPSQVTPVDSDGNASSSAEDGGGGGGGGGGPGGRRYHVADFDFAYVATPFVVSMWVIFASAAKIVFHLGHRLSSVFPESCLLIVIGVILGLILFSAGNRGYSLDATTFFLVLMPPIILDAGYFLPTRPFFDNIGTILLFAIVGTLLNTLWIGVSLWVVGALGVFNLKEPLYLLHVLVYASLLAAVDPVAVLAVFEEMKVNDVLYIIVLGESLLNDGISVVFYRMFTGFSIIGLENILTVDVFLGIASFLVIVFGSTFIGILYGFLGGFFSRFTSHVRVIEPIIVFVIGYMSYLTAEMFHLSGIISCMFCGVTMKKYVEANISLKSHTTIKYFMKMLSSICESIIFMYLGISVVCDKHVWNGDFVVLTILFCLIFRTAGVLLLTAIANHVRSIRLSYIDQFIMSYGGLRGAVAFALAVLLSEDFPHRNMFITTTIVVIYFTNLIMGSTIKPLVNCLRIKKSNKHKPSMNEKLTLRCIDHLMVGVEDITGQHGHHLIRERFLKFDSKYLKPCLIRKSNAQPRGWSILNVCQKLDEHDARELLKHSASFNSQPDFGFLSSNSLARLFSNASLRKHFGDGEWNDSSESCLNADPQQRCRHNNQWRHQQQAGHDLTSLLGLPETGSMTCLDLQAQEVQDTRKMRDDSKIHHIIDDSMFKPRKVFVPHRHYPAAETDHPHHHNVPVHLRHLLSHSLRHQGPNKSVHEPDGSSVASDIPVRPRHGNGTGNTKSSKNVSFAEVTDVVDESLELDNNSLQAEEGDRDSTKSTHDDEAEEEEEDEGIIFIASSSPTPPSEELDDRLSAPVAAELSLPWKRYSSREPLSSVITHSYPDEGNPVRGEAPSWVDSPEYLAETEAAEDSFSFVDVETNECLPMNVIVSESLNTCCNVTEEDGVNCDDITPLQYDATLFPWENPTEDASGADALEFNGNNGFLEDALDGRREVYLPLPWKNLRSQTCSGKMNHRNQDPELGLSAGCSKRHLVKSNSVPARDSQVVKDDVCVHLEDDLPPLPWRNPTIDRVIPDQHAPRPPCIFEDQEICKQDRCGLALPWKEGDDGIGSPCASFDRYSVHPQMSCHSFRLSEAESRHSEPVHHHHVIEIALRQASVDLESFVLPELEEMGSYERVSHWLNATEESMAWDNEEGEEEEEEECVDPQ